MNLKMVIVGPKARQLHPAFPSETSEGQTDWTLGCRDKASMDIEWSPTQAGVRKMADTNYVSYVAAQKDGLVAQTRLGSARSHTLQE